MIDTELSGKITIITGANHGIGAATAMALAAQGADIFLSYYIPTSPYSEAERTQALKAGIGGEAFYAAKQQISGEQIISEIKTRGGSAAGVEIDLGIPEKIPMLFESCEKQFGPADILVINHAHDIFDTFDVGPSESTESSAIPVSCDTIDRHYSVNARAGALMIGEFTKRFKERKSGYGRIISLITTRAHSQNVSYAASKQALASYTLSAAEELGRYGITANIVCPGATQTGYITPEIGEKLSMQTPLGRVGESDDIADVIVFLASKQARWVTGNILYAAGGFHVPTFLG